MFIKFLVFASIFSLLACNSYKSKVGNAPEDTVTPAAIDYAFVNAKVFQPKCLKCHSLAGGDKGGVNLETYENIIDHLADIQNVVFVEESMPTQSAGGPLGAYEKNVLKMWLDAGAPRDGSGVLPAPKPTPVTTLPPTTPPVVEPPVTPPTTPPPPVDPGIIGANWNEISKNIFVPKCVGCHQVGGRVEDIPLTDKDWVIDPANGLVKAGSLADSPLYFAITRQDKYVMPPQRSGMTLSQQEIDAIKNWILNGAKD